MVIGAIVKCKCETIYIELLVNFDTFLPAFCVLLHRVGSFSRFLPQSRKFLTISSTEWEISHDFFHRVACLVIPSELGSICHLFHCSHVPDCQIYGLHLNVLTMFNSSNIARSISDMANIRRCGLLLPRPYILKIIMCLGVDTSRCFTAFL